MKKNRIQGQPPPWTLVSGTPFQPNASRLAPGVCLAGFLKAPTSDGIGNFAFAFPRPDRGCQSARPTSLPCQNTAKQPLLGTNAGVHKTLIYNI
jgi:hypothetical protein